MIQFIAKVLACKSICSGLPSKTCLFLSPSVCITFKDLYIMQYKLLVFRTQLMPMHLQLYPLHTTDGFPLYA
ncbi:hypothetical protein XENTR_v10022067 [Xenopus tropicalis]|nr:hypothetical protein XENTR_v10022067 [Xenopus tropicalis]